MLEGEGIGEISSELKASTGLQRGQLEPTQKPKGWLSRLGALFSGVAQDSSKIDKTLPSGDPTKFR